MRYIIEIVQNKKVISRKIFENPNSHKNLIYGIMNDTKIEDEFLIYILSNKGDRWLYAARTVDGDIEYRKVGRHIDILNRDDTILAFAGDRNIFEYDKDIK